MRKTILSLLAGAALIAALIASSSAMGKGGPPPGKGHTETAANNLSVPTVFIGSAGFGLTDPALQMPTGDPLTGYYNDPDGYYYVQGVHKWQAEYVVLQSDTATAAWGDNLTGSASIKAGHPIRVEMGLTSDTVGTTLQGFAVVKLDDRLADRESPYGTKAAGSPDDSFSGQPLEMAARVWVAGATLSITDPSGVVTTVAMPGEINAGGAPVFGYNWRPSVPGAYTLQFKVPEGTVTFSYPADTTLGVTVTSGGGGGGGHK